MSADFAYALVRDEVPENRPVSSLQLVGLNRASRPFKEGLAQGDLVAGSRTTVERGQRRRRGVVWRDVYRAHGKRVTDVLGASILIVALLPLFVILAVVVTTTDGGSPIFRHERVGRDGRRFGCIKFRSMVPNARERLGALLASDAVAAAEWARDHKLEDDPRITRIGRFLRRTSLDELPQLFNVVLGDMSLVGPRPITEEELPRYGRYAKRYLVVRPGLTGLWQISGRNGVTYDERVVIDVCYTRRYGAWIDMKILLLTPAVVFKSTGW